MFTLVHCCPFLTYWLPLWSETWKIHSLTHPENESQRRVNDFWSCILGNLSGDWIKMIINKTKATFKPKKESDTLPATCWKSVSTECQQCLALHHCQSEWRWVTDIHKWQIGCLYREYRKRHAPSPILKMSINILSMIFGLVSQENHPRLHHCNAYWKYWPPWRSKLTGMTSLLSPKNNHHRSVNDFWSCNSGN